jgi:hypothetical protein
VAIAAQWSAASGSWVEIGEVTGASNAGTIDGPLVLSFICFVLVVFVYFVYIYVCVCMRV